MDTRSRFEAFLNYLIFILGKGREFGLVELSSSASAILKPKNMPPSLKKTMYFESSAKTFMMNLHITLLLSP